MEKENEKWRGALIAYVIGEAPGAVSINGRYATDECTTKQTRISFVRVLIEVDVTKVLPEEITILDPNGKTCVQFDWKPQYCDRCLKIGHNCPPPKDTHPTQDPVPDEFEKPN
ncbi:hypothetical protein KY284_036281 [Solanum tuberosum]|nr:hypothetical protein KY284_036281 [Solanum tuberosum]